MPEKDDPALAELARRGFRLKKELGQSFLFNKLILEQITEAAGIKRGDTVIEAGAGAGSLTAVLAQRQAKVIAVELDRDLIPFLKERFSKETGVEIIRGDILKLDLDALAPSYKICANLPYHISTAFVTMAFRRLKGLEGGAFLLQKEVADKITAQPGQDNYGLLALAAAWYGEAERIMILEPAYFTPPPQVDSALIAFRRKAPVSAVKEDALWLAIRGVFNQRRKNLLNGLKALGTFTPSDGRDWAEVLEEAGVDRRRRPETLSLAEFTAIIAAAGYKT